MEQILANPVLLLLIAVWTLFWKGLALWQAAKNDQRNWFIAILIINTLGILEIIYLQWFAKKKRLWDRIKESFPWTR